MIADKKWFEAFRTITPYVMSRRHNTEFFPEGRLSAESCADSTLKQRAPLAQWTRPCSDRATVRGARLRSERSDDDTEMESNDFDKCCVLSIFVKKRLNISQKSDIIYIITFYARDTVMAASYKKLWKLLIDRDLKKKDLCAMANISTYTIGKMNRGDNITTDVLVRICSALDCSIEDIMEIVPEK